MRPIDPRLLREAPAARRFLVTAGGLGLLAAAAIVAQAVALGRMVAGVFLEHHSLSSGDVAVLVAATCVRAAVAWGLESGGRVTSLAVASELRAKALAHLIDVRPGDVPAGELAAATVGGLDALDPYFARFLPQLVLSAIVPAAIFAWVVVHDAQSAIVMAVTLPLIPVFGILVGRVTRARTLRRFSTLSLLSGYFLDVVRGLPTLRAFDRGRAQSATIASVSDDYRRETMGTLRIAFLSALVLELAATLSVAAIAVEIGLRLVDGGIALAPAFAVLVLAPEYYGPLRSAAAQFHASADGLAAASRVLALLDLPPAVAVPARPAPAPDVRSASIRFEHVSLQYEGRPEPAVDNVSLAIGPGERVALAGPSGAGKSSVLALLLRLVDPTCGRILAGGVDLVSVDPEAWRAQLAWLPQRPHLPVGTVRRALGGGADDELWEALERASVSRVVAALPLGLETELGERTPLSAGEIRRLALARALVAAKPLLVVDEPTAHLDANAAEAVASTLASLPRDVTLVVATHDQLLLDVMDTVVDLEAARLEAVA